MTKVASKPDKVAGATYHLHINEAQVRAISHACEVLARRVDVLTLARVSGHKDLALLNSVYYRESSADVALRLR